MPTDVALIGDTHLYADFSDVSDWVRERIFAADHTIHCGDFVSTTAYEYFRDMAVEAGGEFTAVRGNSDLLTGESPPEAVAIQLEDVPIVATHPLGVGDASLQAEAYRETIVETVREHGGRVGFAGHTHRITVRHERDGETIAVQ